MAPKSKKPNTIKINSNHDIFLIGNIKSSYLEWENGTVELVKFINNSYNYDDHIKHYEEITKEANQIQKIFGTNFRNDLDSYFVYYYLLKEKPELSTCFPNNRFLDNILEISYEILANLCFQKDEISNRKEIYFSEKGLIKYYYQTVLRIDGTFLLTKTLDRFEQRIAKGVTMKS
jgi:hypothetical protein